MYGHPIYDITSVKHEGDYRLRLTFADGTDGVVDIASLITFRGVFEPLRDVAQFAEVYVDPEVATIEWPNGADLDPLVLYAAVTKRNIEDLLASPLYR